MWLRGKLNVAEKEEHDKNSLDSSFLTWFETSPDDNGFKGAFETTKKQTKNTSWTSGNIAERRYMQNHIRRQKDINIELSTQMSTKSDGEAKIFEESLANGKSVKVSTTTIANAPTTNGTMTTSATTSQKHVQRSNRRIPRSEKGGHDAQQGKRIPNMWGTIQDSDLLDLYCRSSCRMMWM